MAQKPKLFVWRFLWPWLPVLAVYAVICWFSAQPGEVSDPQSGMVRELISAQWEWVEVLVRKLAHVALFFGLGAAAAFAWLKCGGSSRKALLRSVVLCAVLAALDELHQYFVPERAALLTDVLLDTAGAALGALCAVGLSKTLVKNGKY